MPSKVLKIIEKDPIIKFFTKRASKRKLPFYLVGGIPRDILMGKEKDFTDYDFVVIGDPFSLAQDFKKQFPSKIIFYRKFRSAEIKFGDTTIDLTMARKESYRYPGSLPDVEPVYDIEEDLKRRDFTINSIAISLNFYDFGNIYDPFSGKKAIEEKLLQVNREGSFYEDPTRAFRAIRYRHRLNFNYSDTTIKEFKNVEKSIRYVSFSRIKKEMEFISTEKERINMFYDLGKRGFIKTYLKVGKDYCARRDFEKLSSIMPFKKIAWRSFFIPFLNDEIDVITLYDEMSFDDRVFFEKVFEGKEKINNNIEHFADFHPLFKNYSDDAVLFLSIYNKMLLEYLEKRKRIPKILKGDEIHALGVPREKIEYARVELEKEFLKENIKDKEDAKKFISELKDKIER